MTRTTPCLRITRHDSQKRFTEGLTFIATINLYLISKTFVPPDFSSFPEALVIKGIIPILNNLPKSMGIHKSGRNHYHKLRFLQGLDCPIYQGF
jgi:hypothetical protein